MATKFVDNIENGLIGFWEITERTEDLFDMLDPTNEELDRYLLIRNELRKREWLAVRLLLRQMATHSSKIDYEPTGKPLLVNFPGHISLSHSSNCVAIYLHPTHQPGIDIESIKRNVERAARRFLSPEELNDCTIDGRLSNKELMLRWCSKEAVFKMVPFNDIDFASQIICNATPINMTEGVFSATFTSSEAKLHIPLHFRCIGDILMVWGHLKI